MATREDFRSRLDSLSPRQRALLAERIDAVLPTSPRRGTSGSPPGLAAYVVARDAALSAEELGEYLAQQLPEHMLPQATTFLESMPLTTSGKVDRRALPAPAMESGRPDIYERARTPAEETLSRIWEEVLCVDEVGVHDNFFELGGDSLLSIRIISRAAQAGLTMTPKQFFDNPTIAGVMASPHRQRSIGRGTGERASISRRGRRGRATQRGGRHTGAPR